MSKPRDHECTMCGERLTPQRRNYRYTEGGISNLVLQSVEIAECPKCGNSDVILPQMAKVHRAIAQALVNSPARLTGEQIAFLRKHLGLSGDELGSYLHAGRSEISRWEGGVDPIEPATERLIRLLAATLDAELCPGISRVARHLPQISEERGESQELHVDVLTLQAAFLSVSKAA